MDTFFLICKAVSFGIVVGFLLGGFKFVRKKQYSEKKSRAAKKLMNKLAFILKYVTFFMLCIGLVWCIYFLALGAFVPDQCDYANNMAELIVAVLTVISIIFAFVEFLRQEDHK